MIIFAGLGAGISFALSERQTLRNERPSDYRVPQARHILLVTRDRGRWALPGGTIKRGETPVEAAERELLEETAMTGAPLSYLFQFGGLNKRHHVFLFETHGEVEPVASREIARCRWFLESKVSTLLTSVPTREIVALLRAHALEDTRGGPGNSSMTHVAWEAACP